MAKKKKGRRRTRSKRRLTLAEEKARLAALFLLLLLPLNILFPPRIWKDANPQKWEQAQIVYADHVRHSTKSGAIYVMHDAEGKPWQMPDEDAFDLDRFCAEVQPGDELMIRYYTWLSGNMVRSIEGYYDYADAARRSREIARTGSYAYAFVLAVSLILLGYILCQLNRVHRFFSRKERT